MASTPNERVRAARERAGLQPEDAAGKLDISDVAGIDWHSVLPD